MHKNTVLRDRLLPTSHEFFDDNKWYFHVDGAPCYRVKVVKTYLSENEIQPLLWWPGQFPDINSIENLWHRVKKLKNDTTNYLQ